MKKVILIFILLIISGSVLAKDEPKTDINYNEIENRLLQYADLSTDKTNNINNIRPIYDELVEKDYDSNSSISSDGKLFKMTITKRSGRIIQNITDELLSQDYIDKAKTIRHIGHKNNYDFSKTNVPVKIKIEKHLNLKNNVFEGDIIPFVATHDFVIGDTTYNKGTVILGRIETISASDAMGIPETIRIDNFYIDVNNDNKFDNDINLHGHISKEGANRALWVYPLYQAGNMAFYAAGYIFVPIHGGHAKISPDEEFTIFYETPPEVKKQNPVTTAKKSSPIVNNIANNKVKKKTSSTSKKTTRRKK